MEQRSLADVVRQRIQLIFNQLGNYRIPGLYNRILRDIERVLIEEALLHAKGSQKNAAEILGIHRNTLRLRMKKLEIKVPKS